MTLDAAAEQIESIGTSPPRMLTPEGAREPQPRTFAQQTFHSTFARWGARLGATWILMLALAAVFAPVIANSFPLLIKSEGHWSSPMAQHLAPADVVLFVTFIVVTILLLVARVRVRQMFLMVLWFVALTLPLTLWPSVIRDGWRQVPETFSSRSGNVALGLFGALNIAVLATALGLARLGKKGMFVLLVASVCLAGLLIVLPVRPPENVVYQEYRDKTSRGEIEWQLKAPVPYSANDYQRDQTDPRLKAPSWQHLFGTEQNGGDVFSRLLNATRTALSIGFIATGISVTIGVTVGGLMGYFAGWIDIAGMRMIEILEAVPTLILLLTVCAFFGRSLYLMMVVIGLLQWTSDARFVRAEFLRLRNQDFVQAAQAAGLPLRSIIFRHMLPNGLTPVLVNSSFSVAAAILMESTLSFLGLGLVDAPSWGGLLEQARSGVGNLTWWIATFPGLAIFLTVFSYNLIGEALRDALDPKYLKRD